MVWLRSLGTGSSSYIAKLLFYQFLLYLLNGGVPLRLRNASASIRVLRGYGLWTKSKAALQALLLVIRY